MIDRDFLEYTCTTLTFPGVLFEQQIGIFLKVVAENAFNRTIQERFQHSGVLRAGPERQRNAGKGRVVLQSLGTIA